MSELDKKAVKAAFDAYRNFGWQTPQGMEKAICAYLAAAPAPMVSGEPRLYCNHCSALFRSAADRQEHERESHAVPSRAAKIEAALRSLADQDAAYHGSEIRISCESHADAIKRMADARRALAGEKP